jgi:hypothetical protein
VDVDSYKLKKQSKALMSSVLCSARDKVGS